MAHLTLYYLVAWTAWACPWWMPKSVPKQFVCREKKEIAVAEDWKSAVQMARKAGPGVELWYLRGTELKPIQLKWKTELEVVEEP